MEAINGVNIGDNFDDKHGHKYIVQDIYKVMSTKTGVRIGYICIAQQLNGLASNPFEVPFATVVRRKIIKIDSK